MRMSGVSGVYTGVTGVASWPPPEPHQVRGRGHELSSDFRKLTLIAAREPPDIGLHVLRPPCERETGDLD